ACGEHGDGRGAAPMPGVGARRPRGCPTDVAVMTISNEKLEPRAIFDKAVEHTRSLSPASFDQWFGGIQYDDLTDGVLTLRARDEFVLDWVKTNYLPTLTDKIREMTGWSVQVAWMVDQKLESPVSSFPPTPPV